MKKICYKDVVYIVGADNLDWFQKHCCNWYAVDENNDLSGVLRCYVKWWLYILLFIPSCIFQLVLCLWDGGLKEFSLEPRLIRMIGIQKPYRKINDSNTAFERFHEVCHVKDS